jgi:hypothetical protein
LAGSGILSDPDERPQDPSLSSSGDIATARNVVDATIFALELAGVAHGPTDALNELAGEMVRPEIGE